MVVAIQANHISYIPCTFGKNYCVPKKRYLLFGVKNYNRQDVYEHNIIRKQIVAYILSDFLYP